MRQDWLFILAYCNVWNNCTGGTASKEYLRDLRQRLLRTADALLTSVQASHARQAAADGTPTAGIATQTAGQSHRPKLPPGSSCCSCLFGGCKRTQVNCMYKLDFRQQRKTWITEVRAGHGCFSAGKPLRQAV